MKHTNDNAAESDDYDLRNEFREPKRHRCTDPLCICCEISDHAEGEPEEEEECES